MEHEADNIDVTMICPGPVNTNIIDASARTDDVRPVSTSCLTSMMSSTISDYPPRYSVGFYLMFKPVWQSVVN